MIIDSRTIPPNETLHTDLCIAGSGIAGITLARELAGTGIKVILLESGGVQPNNKTQGLFWGENTGHTYYPLDVARSCGFGGSSHKWLIGLPAKQLGARIHPLEDIDFESKSWVPNSGWPFSGLHLEAFYKRAQKICRAADYHYDIPFWEHKQSRPQLPLDGNIVKTTIFQFTSRNTFIEDHFREIEQSKNIQILTHSTLVDLEDDESGKQVTGFKIESAEGNRFRIAADHYVLALGAIECARTLLLSNHRRSCGIGNQNDLVGRYFMEHPHLWSGRFIPSPGLNLQHLGLYTLHTSGGFPIMGKLTLSEDIKRREKLLNHCVSLHPVVGHGRANILPDWPIDSWPLLKSGVLNNVGKTSTCSHDTIKSTTENYELPHSRLKHKAGQGIKWSFDLLRNAGRHVFGSLYHRTGEKNVYFKLNHMAEQIPNPESRVILSDQKDVLGRLRVRLDWRLTEADVRSIIRSQEIIDGEMRRCGIGRIQIDCDIERVSQEIHGGWHHMGTTRMHADPRKGVVDADGKVHDMSNLFIAGPSTFPTSGYANPVLTIIAMAIRLGDHMKEVLSIR